MMNQVKTTQSMKPMGGWPRRKVVAVLLGGLVSLGLAAPERPAPAKSRDSHYQVVPVVNGGVLTGTVHLDETPQAAPPFPVSKDQGVCGHKIADPSAALGIDGEVQWAFVYLEAIARGKRFSAKPVQINNKGCTFIPYVQGGAVGARIEVVNRDDTLHNVHSYSGRRTLWNLALPIKGFKVPKKLPARPGLVQFKCDLHEWMKGWIHVIEHPYFATTDASGAFQIDDVPPGTYTLVTWHERWGTKRQPIEISTGQELALEVILSPSTKEASQ